MDYSSHSFSHVPERAQASSPQSGYRNHDAQFGVLHQSRWDNLIGRGQDPYEIDLRTQQGIVLGTTEQGISTSFHRLAYTAAQGGWKVLLFDAQGSHEEAVAFCAAMKGAGRKRVHAFPNEPYKGWKGSGQSIVHRFLQLSTFREPYYQHIATLGLATVLLNEDFPAVNRLSDIVERLDILVRRRGPRNNGHDNLLFSPIFESLRSPDLQGLPLRYQALSALLGETLNGTWSYDFTDAAYFSFNAWDRPEEARLQARFLLADLASFLCERAEGQPRVLLLIRHPEQLFELEQLATLFSRLDRAGGSLFLAVRSIADLGKYAPLFLKNASLLLVHRSMTTAPFEPYLSTSRGKNHSFVNGVLQCLDDDECFAIAKGEVARLRIMPTPIDMASLAAVSHQLRMQHLECDLAWHPGKSRVFMPPDPFDIETWVGSSGVNDTSAKARPNQVEPAGSQEHFLHAEAMSSQETMQPPLATPESPKKRNHARSKRLKLKLKGQ